MSYGLHLYAATVKNLRGVIFSLSDKALKANLKWLSRHFKYRNLGFPPSLIERYEFLDQYLSRKQFIRLWYPTQNFNELINELCRLLRAERLLIESLSLSSVYVSPLIIVGYNSVNALESFSLFKVTSKRHLTNSDLKLHLRIADYSVLDMYAWSIENSHKILSLVFKGKDYRQVLEERVKRVCDDSRRFWRIVGEGELPVVMYLDLLSSLIESCTREDLRRLIMMWKDVVWSTLAAIAGFILTL